MHVSDFFSYKELTENVSAFSSNALHSTVCFASGPGVVSW